MSQNAIADIGKWPLSETRALAEAQAALAVFTGAALTGADGSASKAKSHPAIPVDAVTLLRAMTKQ